MGLKDLLVKLMTLTYALEKIKELGHNHQSGDCAACIADQTLERIRAVESIKQ